MIAVDFFCGAGGLTYGMSKAGINVVLGIDKDREAGRTYETNNQPAQYLVSDLFELNPEAIRHYTCDTHPNDLLFAACAPCQPFSKLDASATLKRERTLLLPFLRFVETYRPGQVVLENVPGLAKVPANSTYSRFKKKLRSIGYSIAEGILDAKSFGTPQTRRRLVLIATLGVDASLPEPLFGPGLMPYTTVRDAISHFPEISAGQTHPDVPNHRAANLAELNLTRIKATPPNGGDRRQWPIGLLSKCHQGGFDGHSDVYGRMWWDRPSPALTCRCHSFSNGRFGHPEQDRAISLREAARLQSFPDNYVFYGPSMGSLARQIGNAVPVSLAEALGRHIMTLAAARDLSEPISHPLPGHQ